MVKIDDSKTVEFNLAYMANNTSLDKELLLKVSEIYDKLLSLESKTNLSETELKNRISSLETKEDTLYDDTYVKKSLEELKYKLDSIKPVEQNVKIFTCIQDWDLGTISFGKMTIPFKPDNSVNSLKADVVVWKFFMCSVEESFSEDNIYGTNYSMINSSYNTLASIFGSDPMITDDGFYLESNHPNEDLSGMIEEYRSYQTEEEKRTNNMKFRLEVKVINFIGDNDEI